MSGSQLVPDSSDQDLLSEASSPTTSQERLAQLAHTYPETRAAVAANPSAYEGLLTWLAQFPDPAVQASLRARSAALPPVAPVAAPAGPPQGVDGLGIAALVLSILTPPIGAILAIPSLVAARRAGRSRGLGAAALIIGSVLSVIGIIGTVVAVQTVQAQQLAAANAVYCARLSAYPDLFSPEGALEKLSYLDDIAPDQDARAEYYASHLSDYEYLLAEWSDLKPGAPDAISFEVNGIVDELDDTVTHLHDGDTFTLAYIDGPGGADFSVGLVQDWAAANCS